MQSAHLSVPSFFLDCLTLEKKGICCPETSVTKYQSTLHNIPEEQRFCLHSGRSLKSRMYVTPLCLYYGIGQPQEFPTGLYFTIHLALY
jgi:hypothetical protein